MIWLEILLIISILIYLFYKWSIKTYNIFEERHVPYNKPFPLLGNSWSLLKTKGNLHKFLLNLYKENKKHKVFGFFNFRDPIFVINDPELIKMMGVKDFDAFTNHQGFALFEDDKLLKGMLTVMQDQRWKNMRNTVTPIFTGAKMRAMFVLMNDSFVEVMQFLHQKLEPGKESFELELKDCFYRLSNDLIATTAFGLKTNSFENEKNEFYIIGKSFSSNRGKMAIKFMLMGLMPKLLRLLNVKLIDEKKNMFFMDLVVEAMKYREKHNIVRPDMINLLMEAKRESEFQWSEEEIVAQCLIFFFAAFENNATLLSTTCYELADNQDVQEKLYEEIIEFHEHLNGKTLDYETLQNMKYLDMVVQETLRKWSLTAMLDRICGKDYKAHDDEGNLICEFKKGDKIWFQVIGLHFDEEYFDEPEVFNPERFNNENKNKIKPFTYLPFGIGPRICIGNRYALMQAKAMIFYLLKDFKIERSEKLSKNLLEDIQGFSMTPKNGFWFKLSKH